MRLVSELVQLVRESNLRTSHSLTKSKKKKKDPDNISDTVRNKERGRKTETLCVQS